MKELYTLKNCIKCQVEILNEMIDEYNAGFSDYNIMYLTGKKEALVAVIRTIINMEMKNEQDKKNSTKDN